VKQLLAAFFLVMVGASPASADHAGICVQVALKFQGLQPGPFDGIVGQRTIAAANQFASANPRLDLPALEAGTVAEWCATMIETEAVGAIAEAEAWLDRALAALRTGTIVGSPEDSALFRQYVEKARRLLNGRSIAFGGGPIQITSLDFEYGAVCPALSVAGQLVHRQTGPERMTAAVLVCVPFLVMSRREQAQTILHEIFHAQEGEGECRAMWFEYWMATLGTGGYESDGSYWRKHSCDAALLAGLPPPTRPPWIGSPASPGGSRIQ
jgi:hypothetical protein